jgi:hypothetical protein
VQLQLYRMHPGGNRELNAPMVKRVGIAEIVAVNGQFRLAGRYFKAQKCGCAWPLQGRVMHVPDRCGVDVVMHMFVDDHRAVCIVDVGIMSVRIGRIGHRRPHEDPHMKAGVWPVPVAMVMPVYTVWVPVVLGVVHRRPMVMPAMAMMPRIVSPCRC